jgi:hypothetical protein
LHQVGLCLANRGEIESAQAWFERAVTEQELGDLHGRVDRESLQLSIEARDENLSALGRQASPK